MFKYLRGIGLAVIILSLICTLILIVKDALQLKTYHIPLKAIILLIYLVLFSFKNKICWYCGVLFNTLYLMYIIMTTWIYGGLFIESFTFPIYKIFGNISEFIGMAFLYFPLAYIPLLLLFYFSYDCKKAYGMSTAHDNPTNYPLP